MNMITDNIKAGDKVVLEEAGEEGVYKEVGLGDKTLPII